MIPAIITTSAVITAGMCLSLYQLAQKSCNPTQITVDKLISIDFCGTRGQLCVDPPKEAQTPLLGGRVPRFVDLGILNDEKHTIKDILERFNQNFGLVDHADMLILQRGEAEVPIYTPLYPERLNNNLWVAINQVLSKAFLPERYLKLLCGKFNKPIDGPVEYNIDSCVEIKLTLYSQQ